MASKIVQFKQGDMFPDISEKKPVPKMTPEEFAEFVRDFFFHTTNGFDQMKRSFDKVFAVCDTMKKFNEFLTLHQLDIQDVIMAQNEEIWKLKNP